MTLTCIHTIGSMVTGWSWFPKIFRGAENVVFSTNLGCLKRRGLITNLIRSYLWVFGAWCSIVEMNGLFLMELQKSGYLECHCLLIQEISSSLTRFRAFYEKLEASFWNSFGSEFYSTAEYGSIWKCVDDSIIFKWNLSINSKKVKSSSWLRFLIKSSIWNLEFQFLSQVAKGSDFLHERINIEALWPGNSKGFKCFWNLSHQTIFANRV